MAKTAYINRIAVGVPPYDVHHAFLRFAESLLRENGITQAVFRRMAARSGIEHRYSCLPLMPDWETGSTLDAATAKKAVAAAEAITSPASDARGPAAYRTKMAGVMLTRALASAKTRAGV